ncbi:MAG: hypothetical protein ACE5HS_13305 [bacterium]
MNQRQSLRQILEDKLLSLLTTSVSISAILIAIDTFNAKASLEIQPMRSDLEYHPELWVDFYKTYDIPVPAVVTKISQNTKNNNDSTGSILVTGFKDIMDAHLTGKTKLPDWFFEERSSELESAIFNKRFKAQVYDGVGGMFMPPKHYQTLAMRLKGTLSPPDYFVFINAGIETRIIINRYSIKNTSELDLKNVQIFVTSPVSPISRSRTGNILKVEIAPYEVHNIIKVDENRYRILIPRFKRDDSIGLTVLTRATQLELGEISESFESVRRIKTSNLFFFWFVSFATLFFFVWFLSRQSSPYKASTKPK